MSRFNSHFRLSLEDIIPYIKEKIQYFHEDSNLKVEEIGDGNINYVFRVRDIHSGKSLVIKQADKLLRSSGRPLDVDRNRIEAEVLELQHDLSKGFTPKIYLYDPTMYAIIMEDISGHENLRLALLACEKFPLFADHITSFMVTTLLQTTDLVLDPGEKKDLVGRYINKELCEISEDLVFTEPYKDYKGRNIVLDENKDFVQREIYEDKDLRFEAGKLKVNFMNNAQALIHGDLHSGSIFVNKESTKVLDPEFAFYGPMGYDVGNVLGNLFFALTNAYVTKEYEEVKDFITWLESTIVEVLDLFKSKFLHLYDQKVQDIMAKEEAFKKWYLQGILSDTAGSAGLEIIRRVVGDSKVVDITGIEDRHQRVQVERILLLTAKDFIKSRDTIQEGKDYMKIFKEYLPKEYARR